MQSSYGFITAGNSRGNHKQRVRKQSSTQAAQAPAVRWSSCVINVMAKIYEFVWEYLQPLLGSKNTVKFPMKNISHYFHSASLVVWMLTLSQRGHLSEVSFLEFLILILLSLANCDKENSGTFRKVVWFRVNTKSSLYVFIVKNRIRLSTFRLKIFLILKTNRKSNSFMWKAWGAQSCRIYIANC